MSASALRGTVLQVPLGSEPGLLLVAGKQFPFHLAGVWQSATAPAPNQTVDVMLDEAGALVSITVIDPQKLGQERMEQTGRAAVAHASHGFAVVRERMGVVLMIVCAVLFIAWFVLPAIDVGLGYGTSRGYSVSDLLGIGFSGSGVNAGFGFWGFLGLLAVVAPWVSPWLRQRWAVLLNCAPLALLIVAFAHLRWQMHEAVESAVDAAGQFGGQQMQALASQMADRMASQLRDAISLQFGAWIVLLLSLYLAFIGIRCYLAPAAAAPTLS